jgi:hypothetical protein
MVKIERLSQKTQVFDQAYGGDYLLGQEADYLDSQFCWINFSIIPVVH